MNGEEPPRITRLLAAENWLLNSGSAATSVQNASRKSSKRENSRPRSLSAICVGMGDHLQVKCFIIGAASTKATGCCLTHFQVCQAVRVPACAQSGA